ncbi:MAG: hypothetical protein IJW20_00700 [Clostridia bacterium]|nr:hypothetical protein [Clostridia bacterium]
MEKNKKSLKLIHIILIGCIFILGIVAGVVFSNIKNENNLTGASLDGKTSNYAVKAINEEYFSKENEVPEESKITKVGNCKNELEIKSVKIDNENLIVKLELNTKNNPIKNVDNLSIFNKAKLEIGNDIYALNNNYYKPFKVIEVEDNLYEIYSLYDVTGLEYDKNIKFTANIIIEEFDDFFIDVDDEPKSIGDWKLEFAINEEMKTDFNEKYEFENLLIKSDEDKDYGGEVWEILDAKILEENVIINGLLTNYTTEPGILYSVEIFDENNNSLMLNGKEILIGGVRQDLLLKKFDLESEIKIKFDVAVYGEEEKLGQGEETLKISDYRKEVQDVEENIVKVYGDGLSVSFDSTNWEIQANNIYDVIDLNNLQYPINISFKGNYEYSEDFVINKTENIFNESLEEIFENRKKLLELGMGVPRAETYIIGVDVGPYDEWGNPADRKFYEFTDAEVMEIYNGATVTKDDIDFDKETFVKHAKETYDLSTEYKNFGNVVVDGRDAITFVNDSNTITRSYIVIVDEYIYEIKVPFDLKLEDEYYEIMDSIKFE